MNYNNLVNFCNFIINENITLPNGSNSFYNIDNGIINLFSNSNKFDIYTDEGSIKSGTGIININQDKFNLFNIIKETEFILNDTMIIDNGILHVHGTMILDENCTLEIKNNSSVIFYSDSKLIIKDNVNLIIDESEVFVFGKVNVHLSNISTLIDNNDVRIDSSAMFEVDGIDKSNRQFSLNDFEVSLRNLVINENTQGEHDAGEFRYGYTWKKSYKDNSKLLELSLLSGSAPLGDFKFSVLGIPKELVDNKQMISELNIKKKSTLYISDQFHSLPFIRPNLYLGIDIGNNIKPGNCNVEGTLTVCGKNSFITLDRGGTLHVQKDALLIISDKAELKCTNNYDTPVLFIDGIMIIDQLEQLVGFNENNIVFGENGSLIISNRYDERKLLWTTPNGIKESYLYLLFKDRLNKIKYYIGENTGIGIDQYFEFYEREMTDWYNGMRLEKAIKEGFIIFNNGFIELDHKIIPWVNLNCNLYDAARLFKNNSTSDRQYRLQQVVDHLQYAGCKNIVFRFIKDDDFVEYTLHLDQIKLKNVLNKPLQSNQYIVTVTSDGQLFINNNINEISNTAIINDESLNFDLVEGDNMIEINS